MSKAGVEALVKKAMADETLRPVTDTPGPIDPVRPVAVAGRAGLVK